MGLEREIALFIRTNATILFSILLGLGAVGAVYLGRDLWRKIRPEPRDASLEDAGRGGLEPAGVSASFDAVESRVSLIEERLDFTERLLDRRSRSPGQGRTRTE